MISKLYKRFINLFFFLFLILSIDIACPFSAMAIDNFQIVSHQLFTKNIENYDFYLSINLRPRFVKQTLQRCSLSEELDNINNKNFSNESFELYKSGEIKGSQGDWASANELFTRAIISSPEFVLARTSKLLAQYQLGEFDDLESQLRAIIHNNPMFADARAALSAYLARKGSIGEARSHWAAAIGLESCYSNRDWLLNVRHWPSIPTNDLMNFIDF